MKKQQIIIGIDVSKRMLDIFIHNINFHFIVENSTKGFAQLLEIIFKQTNCKSDDLLFCFENTGKYPRMLSVFLDSQSIRFVMEPALKIKKSLGMTRGKTDKVDARRIALYAYEKREVLTPTVLPGEEIDRIKALLSLRERLVKHRTACKNGVTDLHDCYCEGENDLIKEIQQRLIDNYNKEIKLLENQILEIIKSNKHLFRNFRLVLSVKGIGKISTFYLIAFTANFTAFSNARAFACYTGIAPFESSSGTLKGTPRINHLANHQIKSLLNMAAVAAIRIKGEYKEYYLKRVNELGKNKMSTLNIIRNKLIYRVFAVVNRGTPYVDLYKFCA